MWLIIILCGLTILALTRQRFYNYWTDKGVPQIKPRPIVGNMGPLLFKKMSSDELIQDMYSAFPDSRYCGIYQFFRPTLIVRSPDLIKAVTIKDFGTFPEHRFMVPPEVDPIFGNNLFSMRGGSRWSELRTILSPFFTHMKLKSIFGSMQKCAEQCIQHIEKRRLCTFEMYDFLCKYANDVIGSSAYGVTCNSFENPNNDFLSMGKAATTITPWKSFVLLLNSSSTFFLKVLKPRIVSKQAEMFFHSITTESIKVREKQNIMRTDIINMLLEARKAKPDMELTDMDITSHAYVFLLAGLETTARSMCGIFYELALNLDIQKRLQDEIDEVLSTGPVTYKKLIEMKYIGMVISEALRLRPPIMFVERNSVKPFTIEAKHPGEKQVQLDCPIDVWIPIYAIQRDPKYFVNPDKFDPERFSDTNKHKIVPFSYLPFGTGPRSCIGFRYALLEMKIIIFHILSKYNILPTEKTPIPLVLRRGELFPSIKGGLWLKFQARNNL